MKIKLIDTNTNKIYDSAIELYQDNNWEDYQDYCWFLETLFVEEDGFSNIKIIIN